ncbi:MAG TPA: TadE family protein [Candidatus Limnocylindria bacterium]
MRRAFRTARWWADDRGQSIVETALMLPIMIFLILAGGDMARGFAIQIAIQNGARAGAEAAAIDFSPTATETEARARDEMSRTPGMDGNTPLVSVTFAQIDGITACVNPPTLATPCFATVRVRMTWRTITAWPLIPNTFNFDRQTTMRMVSAP